MGSWLFNRSKNSQREKIIHDVFANSCFGSISCAKNLGSSELLWINVKREEAKIYSLPLPFIVTL